MIQSQTMEVGDGFICSAMGSEQHIWIKDMVIMMKKDFTIGMITRLYKT
jgi:hypothetical protein